MTSMCLPNASASLGLLYGGQEMGENPPTFCEAGPPGWWLLFHTARGTESS